MYDPFRRLPAPILLMTMKFIPTLPALCNLTRASGAAAEMFEELPAEIVEAVIRRLPEELRRIIRAVALTLSDQCADQTSSSKGSESTIESALELLEIGTTMKDLTPRGLPLPSVRMLVDCACHNYQLAAAFLECHIKRLNAIQPQHLDDPNHRFNRDPFKDYPKGRAYTPPITGAPSWVEEYRVVRALWLLQLCRLLGTRNEPAKDKGGCTGGLDYRFPEASRPRLNGWQPDNMECVQDWLTEMQISLCPIPEILDPSSPQISLEEADSRSILEHSPTDKCSQAWQQDFDASQCSNRGFRLFHGYGTKYPSSVLKNSVWKTFRRLGFGIWDLKRMVMMELFSVAGEEPNGTKYRTGVGVQLDVGDICFTWKSIEDQKIP